MTTTRTPVRARVRRLAAPAVAAAALSLGIATGTAQASVGTPSATLSISGSPESFDNDVRVTGHVPMTTAEAQALIGSGHRVVFRLWGSDQFDDDLIAGPFAMSLRSSARGLEFTRTVRITDGELDEDYGCLIEDEVYAGVRLLDRDGVTVRKAETNRIDDHQGCHAGSSWATG